MDIEKISKEIERVKELYNFDKAFKGYNIVAGVDEVGRGPLAGPIVACAVILDLNVIDNDITYIDDYLTNAVVKIEKIIILKGICTNGKCSVTKIDNDNYYIKNIFKYSNWHYDMPLLTKYIKLIDTGEEILEFLRHVKIPTFVVRGDENRIMEVIDDRKEGIE